MSNKHIQKILIERPEWEYVQSHETSLNPGSITEKMSISIIPMSADHTLQIVFVDFPRSCEKITYTITREENNFFKGKKTKLSVTEFFSQQINRLRGKT